CRASFQSFIHRRKVGGAGNHFEYVSLPSLPLPHSPSLPLNIHSYSVMKSVATVACRTCRVLGSYSRIFTCNPLSGCEYGGIVSRSLTSSTTPSPLSSMPFVCKS